MRIAKWLRSFIGEFASRAAVRIALCGSISPDRSIVNERPILLRVEAREIPPTEWQPGSLRQPAHNMSVHSLWDTPSVNHASQQVLASRRAAPGSQTGPSSSHLRAHAVGSRHSRPAEATRSHPLRACTGQPRSVSHSEGASCSQPSRASCGTSFRGRQFPLSRSSPDRTVKRRSRLSLASRAASRRCLDRPFQGRRCTAPQQVPENRAGAAAQLAAQVSHGFCSFVLSRTEFYRQPPQCGRGACANHSPSMYVYYYQLPFEENVTNSVWIL